MQDMSGLSEDSGSFASGSFASGSECAICGDCSDCEYYCSHSHNFHKKCLDSEKQIVKLDGKKFRCLFCDETLSLQDKFKPVQRLRSIPTKPLSIRCLGENKEGGRCKKRVGTGDGKKYCFIHVQDDLVAA
jgi:hypothetical protein